MSGAVYYGKEGKNFKHRNRVSKVRINRHFAGRSHYEEDDDDDEELIFSNFSKKKKMKKKKQTSDAIVIKRGITKKTKTVTIAPPPTNKNIIPPPPPPQVSSMNRDVQPDAPFQRLPPPSSFIRKEEEESSDESDSDDEDSDSDSDSDGEDILSSFSSTRMSYVKKVSRKKMVKTKEDLEKEEERRRVEQLEQMKKRKEETQIKLLKIIIDEEKKEMEGEESDEEDQELLEADDEDHEEDGEEEYDLWMEREKNRIIRYKTERYMIEKEKREMERLRGLSAKEREELDQKLTLKNQRIREELENKKKEGKSNFQFMQRFFKKGVFFQGDDDDGKSEEILERDFQQPTMQDKTNYKMLPKILQNKYFGKKGNVKWTHLSNEDTTDWDSPWFSSGKDSKRTGQKRKPDRQDYTNENKRKRRKQ